MKHPIPETESHGTKTKQSIPLPPPLPRFNNQKNVTTSVTNQEIAKFWRKKRVEEEEHFLAAIKAAARVRGRNLKEDEYKLFLESLENDEEEESKGIVVDNSKDQKNDEVRVGIKDWWKKSKYAYLNQPALGSDHPPKRRISNYTPNYFSYKPTPMYPTSLGVF